jgi:hypothetical protein
VVCCIGGVVVVVEVSEVLVDVVVLGGSMEEISVTVVVTSSGLELEVVAAADEVDDVVAPFVPDGDSANDI